MGTFTVTKENDGNYYVTLKAKNGRKILSSSKHLSKLDCINDIETIRASAIDNLKYEYKKTYDGKFYFRLKSIRGEVLGNSELYETSEHRSVGIETLKKVAPMAVVIDF